MEQRTLARLAKVDSTETFAAARFQGDQRLLKALHNGPPLRQGDRSDAVAVVQSALADMGYEVVADRIYGPKTAATVRAFQTDYGVRPLGGSEAGHKTLSSLDVMFRDEGAPAIEPVSKALTGEAPGDAGSKAKGGPIPSRRPPVSAVVPISPAAGQDPGNFKCKTKHTLRIEVFFVRGASGTKAAEELRHATEVLAEHDVSLNFIDHPIILPAGAQIQQEVDWCQFVSRQLTIIGRDRSRLPVFFVPAAFLRGRSFAGGNAGVTYQNLKTLCADNHSEVVDVDRIVVVDCCSGCPVGTFVHELGHAVGNGGHIADTFMHENCRGSKNRRLIRKEQLERFCVAPF